MFVRIGYVVTEQGDATRCSISEMLYEMLSSGTLGKPSQVTSRTLNINCMMTGALGRTVMPVQMRSC